MSNEKFTPGEWWVSGMVDFSQPVSFDAAIETNKTFIAFLATQDKDELNANAALIAASPDMYRMLIRAFNMLDGTYIGGELAKEIDELLKKARGKE